MNLSVEWKNKLKLNNPSINRDSYLRKIEGLVYGEDPRQGFLENNVFYHPELKFEFPTPQGWNYQNTPQRVQLAPKGGKAILMMTLAGGTNLQSAAEKSIADYNLRVIESVTVKINGLNAISILADVKPKEGKEDSNVRTLSYLIAHNNAIYHILGASSIADFNTYSAYFSQSMKNFKELKDVDKLNKKAERIRIKTVPKTGTLKQVLGNYKVSESRMDELSILNGMQLTDRVQQGSLIKIIAN
jgi:predicted Zn-dependent protease